ncbi:hydroxymethylbilane synthase [Thermodesulforhabdus norvegica]|uniref:hydroxymethylbilane synthase n=1 Tax=Thermodesulforhabdus norvegica TaxID=39841 RepID=UPI000A607015|nr:hydroxymethylbilane synthase [Thermodesulforhabdus norvegica]
MERIVLGTRGSKLALKQTEIVKNLLVKHYPGLRIEVVTIKTTGDRITDVPLARIGGKGLFVKEIEEALLEGRIDAAVHSMKDVPSVLPEGLEIVAIPPREDPRDVIVCPGGYDLATLPRGAVVGTSSLRRASQIRHRRPDLQVQVLRGNLDTRLRKVMSGQYDAVILAAAGIRRMGWDEAITAYLDPEEFLPAVGQGAIGIEARSNDEITREILRPLHDEATARAVEAERSFLRTLEGGCQVPIGAHCFVESGRLRIIGMVSSIDGSSMYREEVVGLWSEAEELGRNLAMRILQAGAKAVLDEIYAALPKKGTFYE